MTALFIATQRHSHLQPEYALKDERTRVGRHPENDIAIMLESISRFHAEVIKQGNFYIVQDCQSRNGTYLNGDRLTGPCPIRQGDRIQFGNVEFIFRLSELSEPSAQSVSETSVSIGKRGTEHRVLKSTPVDEAQRELASAAGHDSQGALSKSVSTLYQLLLYLREANLDDPETMKSVLQRTFEVVPADRGAVLMDVGGGDDMQPVAWHRRRETKDHTSPSIQISTSICEAAARDRAAVLVSDAQDDDRFKNSTSVAGEIITSAICVPLVEGATPRGLIYCDTQQGDRLLSETDLSFVGTVAAEVSYALWSKRSQARTGGSGERPGVTVANDDLHHAGGALEKVLQQCTNSSPTLGQALVDNDIVAAKGAWKQVKTGLKRLNKVLAEMMNYSRPPAPQLANVDVNKIIGETLEAFGDELRQAKIEVLSELRANLARRCLDEEALYRSLINLVENAYEALLAQKGGGRITMKSYETSQGALIIEVADNGPGVEPAIQARAFQPFNAGTGSRGIGMGLAMTRRLLEGMDGSVTLSSEPSRGTTVTIIFAPSTKA